MWGNDMVTHMKTTIDIADDLFLRTKKVSKERGVPMREMISEGLVHVLQTWDQAPTPRIQAVTFKGEGLAPEFREGTWQAVRDAAYEGHGA
jgi:hypothetical protein